MLGAKRAFEGGTAVRLDALIDRAVAPDRPAGVRDMSRGRTRRGIGFLGLFGAGNFGNDGSFEAMLNAVRRARPDAELVCICGNPAAVTDAFGVRSVPIDIPYRRRSSRLLRLLMDLPQEMSFVVRAAIELGRLRTLIVPGTGILDDFGTGPRGTPYSLLRWCLLARLLRVKVLFVSIGAGPIHHPASRWLMKNAARLAAYRSYRDRISKDFMTRIGLDTTADSVHPDIAFALPDPPQPPPTGEGGRLTVGVGVMSYNGWRSDKASDEGVYRGYLEKLTRFVSWLLDSGYRVRLLIGDATDQKAIDELVRLIEAGRGPLDPSDIAVEPAQSLHDVMAAIAKTDVVVATRFHNVVCALKLGRPVLSVGYAEKNKALLAAMGLDGFGQHVEELEVDLLIDQFRRLVASRRILEDRIAAANAAFRESLRRQEARIVESFL